MSTLDICLFIIDAFAFGVIVGAQHSSIRGNPDDATRRGLMLILATVIVAFTECLSK